MNARENMVRTIRFQGPDWIPVRFKFNAACWFHYEQKDLLDLMQQHPVLFPDFERRGKDVKPNVPPWQQENTPYRDAWGSVWETMDEGITGAVIEHPLADWESFEGYLPPDPATTKGGLKEGSQNWEKETEKIKKKRDAGQFTGGGLPHGHTFLRLSYLRGYENLILDMADDEPLLRELIGMVESFNLYLIRRYVEMGVDQISYPEDLGMQQGPMLSPQQFRKYIKPVFNRLIKPARDAGCLIHMHSDGDIRELAEELIDLGIHTLNLQDLVHGIDWIKDNLKGRVCIDLDIDRQNIVRFGSPHDIRELVREEMSKLAAPEGGLMITAGIYPGLPLENIRTLMDALEENISGGK